MTTRRKTGTRRAHPAAPAKRAAAARQTGKGPARKVARSNAAAGGAAAVKVAALAADCTVAQAAIIKAQLAKVLRHAAPVTLDLSCVRRIDTAGFQVLAAFIRERRAASRGVHCQGATEAFTVTASLLGVAALFTTAADAELLRTPAAGRA